jgi:hypothetical protein
MAFTEDDMCTGEVPETRSYVDKSGKEIMREPTFTGLEIAPGLPVLSTLPCCVVGKAGLSLIR